MSPIGAVLVVALTVWLALLGAWLRRGIERAAEEQTLRDAARYRDGGDPGPTRDE